jgi:cyclic pyranopterin phosphate synthase
MSGFARAGAAKLQVFDRICPMGELTHLDEQGACRMVDVGDKPVTHRAARASGLVRMRPETRDRICTGGTAKGNVLEAARLAGVMAAKRTADLIPLCHPLPLDSIEVHLEPEGSDALRIDARVQATAKTGVEMEALTAVAAAALTVYDMSKAIDRGMVIAQIQLEEKSGGATGDFSRPVEPRTTPV